jgi:hypothetical protein
VFVLALSGLEARPAFDPIAFFIAVIIIVNVVSAIFKSVRRRATKPQDDQTQVRLDTALQQNRDRVESARAAQLAKLREVIAAARAAQAGVPSSTAHVPPTVLTATVTLDRPLMVSTSTPAATAPQMPASVFRLAPSSAPVPDAMVLQPTAALAGLDSAAVPFPDVSGSQALMTPGSPDAGRRARLAVLTGTLSGANLFVAAAIIGPCAAFRPLGHTPGGW